MRESRYVTLAHRLAYKTAQQTLPLYSDPKSHRFDPAPARSLRDAAPLWS